MPSGVDGIVIVGKRSEPVKSADPSRIIALLNSLGVGEMAVIRAKLDQARQACLELDRADLAERLDEALTALGRAEMKIYRKRVESVVSRLGHLR
jgi:phosphoenolpyruvate-protein kinase (PTS system EI component)